MNQIEATAESVTMTDHLIAIHRRRWWVVVATVVGALAGLLGLRSSTSDQHVVAVSISYKWITDPSDVTSREVVRPSDEGKAAADRRNELVPALKHANITVEGQDESHRVVFTASAGSSKAAKDIATQFAEAFTADRLSVLNKHLDEEIAVEQNSLTELETRLNGPATKTTAEDAAVTLEIIDRTRRLAFLNHARGPEPMIGEPEVVRAETSPLQATNVALPLLGALLGGLLGATVAAAAGRLDRRLYTRSDLERTIDGLPVLAVAGDNDEPAAYLPAAGSLLGEFGNPDKSIGLFSANGDLSSTFAAEGLRRGLGLVAGGVDAALPDVRVVTTSSNDASTGLVEARDLTGVIVVSHFGKTRDAQLVEAVSSLNLIGANVIGLVLAGVPNKELEASRVSVQR